MTAGRLLPPNASPVERGFEAVIAGRIAGIAADAGDPVAAIDPLRTAPSALEALGWQVRTDAWDPKWPVSVQRRIVADALTSATRSGTVAAWMCVLHAYGAVFELTENPGGARFTANIVVRNGNALRGNDVAGMSRRLAHVGRLAVELSLTSGAGVTSDVIVDAAAGGIGFAETARDY